MPLKLTNSVPACWPTCVSTYCSQVGQHVLVLNTYLFDHLELFCRNRIRIVNAKEGSLFFFNEVLVYSFILNLPLVILSGFKAWKKWIRCTAPTYMPLKFSRLAGSQVTEQAKALAGTVNTASFEFDSRADRT